jgi:hypothetical protein
LNRRVQRAAPTVRPRPHWEVSMQTPIEQFAEQHRLRVSRDECNDQIIEGRRGHIYFDDDAPCFMALNRKSASRATWESIGGKLWLGDKSDKQQDVKIEGFTNPKQAIRMAGLFAKRELPPERKQILVERLARMRANAHRNAENPA